MRGSIGSESDQYVEWGTAAQQGAYIKAQGSKDRFGEYYVRFEATACCWWVIECSQLFGLLDDIMRELNLLRTVLLEE